MNYVQTIYEKMQDEQSKMIYINRLNYSLTRDYRFIENMVEQTVRSQPLWKNLCILLKEKNICENMVIFGAGVWGKILYEETRQFISWNYVIDSYSPDKKLGELQVIPFESFVSQYAGEWIVISSYKNCREMTQQLSKYGIPKDRIIDAGSVINQLTEHCIYFDLKELFPQKEKEAFVDAGGFDGATTRQFLEWCKGKAYSYCFEPDEQNILRAKKNLEAYTDYEIIPKALWSKSMKLAINAKGNYATSVRETDSTDGGQTIDAVALDDFLIGKEITFLKMDIEGAEGEALRGAEKVIASQRPKLAISIYHKFEDIWELPQLILEICPDYRFYLRHYSFQGYDTVLYAIV